MHRPCPFDSGLTEPFGFGESPSLTDSASHSHAWLARRLRPTKSGSNKISAACLLVEGRAQDKQVKSGVQCSSKPAPKRGRNPSRTQTGPIPALLEAPKTNRRRTDTRPITDRYKTNHGPITGHNWSENEPITGHNWSENEPITGHNWSERKGTTNPPCRGSSRRRSSLNFIQYLK
jgi:hypothetical protein